MFSIRIIHTFVCSPLIDIQSMEHGSVADILLNRIMHAIIFVHYFEYEEKKNEIIVGLHVSDVCVKCILLNQLVTQPNEL